MIDAMHWLVQGARAHDALFFHCGYFLKGRNLPARTHFELSDSGHGGQTRDLDGDEIDGFDEGGMISGL